MYMSPSELNYYQFKILALLSGAKTPEREGGLDTGLHLYRALHPKT